MTLVQLSRALGLGDDPAAIVERMRDLYAEVDREVAERSVGLDLPCKAGCDACCHESVFLSAPEFLMIAAYLLEHHSAGERRAIVGRMRALATSFEDELLLLEELPPGLERDEVAARVKFRCPLLQVDGLCGVYPARELNARTFGLARDSVRGHPFGCELTHQRLRVLPEATAALFDAREARRRLADRLPATERVQPFPWWFSRFGDLLED